MWLFEGFVAEGRLPPCDELPSITTAQRAIDAHPETVSRLEALPDAANAVWVRAYSPKECPGKGGINVTYDNVTTKEEIKEILGERFFGVPYSLSNV